MYGLRQWSRSPDRIIGCTFLLAVLASLGDVSVVRARSSLLALPDRASHQDGDLPARAPETSRADTFQFGYVDASGYAVVGETWSFDHGGSDPLEGWSALPLAEAQLPFRHLNQAGWNGHGNPSPAPILVGQGSAWLGAFESEADQFCWTGGLGYGDNWCQSIESPGYTYAGSGDVTLSFRYFNDTEPDFDRTLVILDLGSGNELVLNGPDGWHGEIGDPTVGSYPTYSRTIAAAAFGGFTAFTIRIEFRSDGGFSDQDGEFDTDYGPFGVDDVTLDGAISGGSFVYGFEADLEGWTTATCGLAVTDSHLGVASVSNYAILDPCSCGLAGNVLEFHDENGEHPTGQHEFGISPIVDRGALGPQYNTLLGTFDLYAEMPLANGVFYRPGWIYFPYLCPETGQSIWSDRVGEVDTYRYVGVDPICAEGRDVGTLGTLPGDAQLYRFGLEIYSSCDAFGIPPTQCSGLTNQTPLFDNIQVRVTSVPDAPEVRFDVGARFIDGWGQGLLNSTTNPGNADVVYDLSRGNPIPDHLGDSLVVVGPIPTSSTKWEARMWWRIAREGPGAASIPGYAAWKTAVADGLGIVGPDSDFTFGRMDSMQSGTSVSKNRFISEFREDDDDFGGRIRTTTR
ncbi:MAG: hypothetical protein IPK72_23540 [Candidatus Eisenbacteria bacterium]|nr:hypothetical protein [Candidatus Eisenbacteria bacterium]